MWITQVKQKGYKNNECGTDASQTVPNKDINKQVRVIFTENGRI